MFIVDQKRNHRTTREYVSDHVYAADTQQHVGLGSWHRRTHLHLGLTGLRPVALFHLLQLPRSPSTSIHLFILIVFQTLQLCLQFKVHSHNCAQSMTLLNDYVWMGVGKELIAVHCKVRVGLACGCEERGERGEGRMTFARYLCLFYRHYKKYVRTPQRETECSLYLRSHKKIR